MPHLISYGVWLKNKALNNNKENDSNSPDCILSPLAVCFWLWFTLSRENGRRPEVSWCVTGNGCERSTECLWVLWVMELSGEERPPKGCSDAACHEGSDCTALNSSGLMFVHLVIWFLLMRDSERVFTRLMLCRFTSRPLALRSKAAS